MNCVALKDTLSRPKNNLHCYDINIIDVLRWANSCCVRTLRGVTEIQQACSDLLCSSSSLCLLGTTYGMSVHMTRITTSKHT